VCNVTKPFAIRPWQPCLEDVRAVLQVEEETFRDCPYREEDLMALAREGPLRVWLAWQEGQPAGYASAFPTAGLEGPCWELDLLAARPAFRGQGLAQALIRAALEATPRNAVPRAWVAVGNAPSARAFAGAGFQALPTIHELWTYAIRGLVPRRPDPAWPPAAVVQTAEQVQGWAEGFWGPETGEEQAARVAKLGEQGVVAWLADPIATSNLRGHSSDLGGSAGALALRVQTLHYAGLWLEGWWAKGVGDRAVAALLAHAVEKAKVGGLDEVGVMLPAETSWRDALPAQGYGLVGEYQEFRRPVPPAE